MPRDYSSADQEIKHHSRIGKKLVHQRFLRGAKEGILCQQVAFGGAAVGGASVGIGHPGTQHHLCVEATRRGVWQREERCHGRGVKELGCGGNHGCIGSVAHVGLVRRHECGSVRGIEGGHLRDHLCARGIAKCVVPCVDVCRGME